MRGIRRVNRRLLIPAILLAFGIAFGSSWVLKSIGNKVEIENHALVPLKTVEVQIGDEKLRFNNIAAPARTEGKFKGTGEPKLRVKVEKINGDQMTASGSFKPDNYLGTRIKLIVRDDRIEIQQGNQQQ